MDEYLKYCRSCEHRMPAKHFRYVMGRRICLHCADYLGMEDAYRPQPLRIRPSRQRMQQIHQDPPARWSDRRGRVPHWMGDGKGRAKRSAQSRRNEGKPDVMSARVPPRRSER